MCAAGAHATNVLLPEQRDPSWAEYCEEMQERQHGHVPKNFTKIVELTKRTRKLFSDQSLDLDQPLGQILMLK